MILRAGRVEALRLVHDPALVVCLGLALVPAIALMASLPGRIEAGELAHAVDRTMRMSLLAHVALLAASFGGVRTAAAFRAGVVGRDALLLRPGPPFWLRMASSAVGGLLIASCAWALALLGVRGVLGADAVEAADLGAALLMGAGAGTWGAAIGAHVRSPLLVIPAVMLSLSPALLLSALLPDAVAVLPLGSALLALGSPIVEPPRAPGGGAGIVLLWLFVAVASAYALYRRRPLLP